MAEAKPFVPVKFISGVIASEEKYFQKAEEGLRKLLGPVEARSPLFDFDLTDYYSADRGGRPLRRLFLSFQDPRPPEDLSEVKLRTNELEEKIRRASGTSYRPANIDPGYLTAAALVMATAKDFSHRIPLRHGIYAHLELLFAREGVRLLDWTYPDFRREDYHEFFLQVRKSYLTWLQKQARSGPLH